MNVFLISEDLLKSQGLIDDNIWGGYITPSIRLAQDKGLQPAIGGVLYDKILDLVSSGEIKLKVNAKYKALLDDYITPYLMHQVLVEITFPTSFKVKNQGMVQANNEYVQNTSMRDFQYVLQKYENNATFYLNRLTDYLDAHTSMFPEYTRHIDGKMDANNKSYDCSIYLGNVYKQYSIRNDKKATE